ncbi:arrestin domain-containing protein 17-like [Littorina saxatilis]|uniref:Arrestin C-terminal-like domain-containing protein n=1 Tax=Littorina saxatilis TaxID=31220 RepID=A0AAN9BYY8_9CAEN
MKLEVFEIRFDNPRGVYAAGEQVKGNVILRLRNPMKVRKVFLYFEGRAKCHWEVKHGRSKTDYRATETYINETFDLFDAGASGADHPAGEHSYPFCLLMGASLPSSFEGRRGYVRYFCKASINRPWKFDEHTKRAFTVIHPLDLNVVPTAGMPVWGEQDESVEGCCCSVGNVQARLTLNKTGFVPGEPITYTVDIFNKCDSTIERVELDLKQLVTYTGYSNSIFSSGHPKHHTKVDNFSLLNHTNRIKRNTEEHIHRAVAVPPLPPSNLEGCGIIDISYFVELKVNVRWTSITIEREIIIGTIPMHFAGVPQAPVIPGSPASNAAPSAPPLEPPPYSEPPPSYEESVFGRVEIRDENDDEHTSGQMGWAPSYPVYHYDAATQHFQILPSLPVNTPSTAPPAYNQI